MLLYAHQEWMKQILIAIDAYYYDSASTLDALYQFQKAVNNGLVVVPLDVSQWKGTALFGVLRGFRERGKWAQLLYQTINQLHQVMT